MSPKELAAAIRKGHTMIGETTTFFYDGYCGCALGAAIASLGISYDQWAERLHLNESGVEFCARALNAPLDLMLEISRTHESGMPRLAIADWLDTLPDETPMPAKVERESDAAYADRMLRQITDSVKLAA